MRGPHVRFCERREGAILRAYSTDRSRCWPNGLGLRPRITEGNELAMGSSCGPLLARDNRIAEMAGALNPRRPPKIRTRFRRPILMALLFCPNFARAYESRNMSPRGKLAHRRRQ